MKIATITPPAVDRPLPAVDDGWRVGPWLVASALLGYDVPGSDPYPCLCDVEDPNPPQWLRNSRETVTLCRPWVVSKGPDAGRTRSMCPCWGRLPVDDTWPGGCCRWSADNPAHAQPEIVLVDGHAVTVPTHPVVSGPSGVPPLVVSGLSAVPEPSGASRSTIPAGSALTVAHSGPGDVAAGWSADAMRAGLGLPPVDVDPAPPRARRWSAVELTCPCRTPWDGEKRVSGIHCTQCHLDFVSLSAHNAHCRTIFDKCIDPGDLRDVMSGQPVMRRRMVNGMPVWG